MKKVLITAALPYANGDLHLGHIRSTYLPADIYARYCRLKRYDTLYVCATDEHGTPITLSAEKKGMSKQEFVDIYHKKDKEILEKMQFSFDIFHRTSSKENEEMTREFYLKIKENGLIYEKEITQLFCENCNRFLPDRFVKGTCPYCKATGQYGDTCENCGRVLKEDELIDPKCAICNHTPIKKKTKHVFFKLSAMSDKLKEYLKNADLQTEVKNYVLNWIKDGLNDWDISRTMDWGIKIPGYDNLVFYVWFDAPIEYISATKALVGDKWIEYWKNPETKIVHFIGKDIVYHHYLFWPSMLMNVGLNLPTAIPVRGYLNLEGRKFSKSKNWFISIEDFLKKYPADYLRYYETAITPFSIVDADFRWKDFEAKINLDLIANVGNLHHRILILIKKLNNGIVPDKVYDNELKEKFENMKNQVLEHYEKYEFKRALDKIMLFFKELNRFLNAKEPWKHKDENGKAVLFLVVSYMLKTSLLLYPILPETSEKIFLSLGLEIPKTFDFNICVEKKEIKTYDVLFKPVDISDGKSKGI